MAKKDQNQAVSINIKPRNKTQQLLLDTISENDITFAIGPAGTGKTLVATHFALKELMARRYNKIIFSRPAVAADEDLGYLPGTEGEKLDPYMLPIYDCLEWYLTRYQIEDMKEEGILEMAAIGFMRGRSFYDSIIVVDEAQNLTRAQMKMVLTRFGEGCKMIITGDPTQCDLPTKADSGLVLACELIAAKVPGVGGVEFTAKECVRHPVVGRILTALGD